MSNAELGRATLLTVSDKRGCKDEADRLQTHETRDDPPTILSLHTSTQEDDQGSENGTGAEDERDLLSISAQLCCQYFKHS